MENAIKDKKEFLVSKLFRNKTKVKWLVLALVIIIGGGIIAAFLLSDRLNTKQNKSNFDSSGANEQNTESCFDCFEKYIYENETIGFSINLDESWKVVETDNSKSVDEYYDWGEVIFKEAFDYKQYKKIKYKTTLIFNTDLDAQINIFPVSYWDGDGCLNTQKFEYAYAYVCIYEDNSYSFFYVPSGLDKLKIWKNIIVSVSGNGKKTFSESKEELKEILDTLQIVGENMPEKNLIKGNGNIPQLTPTAKLLNFGHMNSGIDTILKPFEDKAQVVLAISQENMTGAKCSITDYLVIDEEKQKSDSLDITLMYRLEHFILWESVTGNYTAELICEFEGITYKKSLDHVVIEAQI